MELNAQTRLLADFDSVSGPVQLTISDGKTIQFGDAKKLTHWMENPTTKELNTMRSIRVGHYLVLLFPKLTGVAKVYKDRLFDQKRAIQPGEQFFRSHASSRRNELNMAMRALQNTHNPETANVKIDADAERKFLDEHDKPLFSTKKPLAARRTQQWFHRMGHEEKAEYCEKFPGTKFKAKQRLIAP